MNLLLFTDADRSAPDLIELHGRRLLHLQTVLGATPGDRVRVGEVDGQLGEGQLLEIDDQHAILRVTLADEPPPKLPVILVLALPRPKMLRRILRSVAEFGVQELHLVNSYKVEKSYWQSPALQQESVRHYMLQGLEQSRDTRLPQTHAHRRFKPWVEDKLPALVAGRTALLADPGDNPPCPHDITRTTVVVVGPEGGFTPYEVEKLREAGCTPVALGPRILRVENAVVALLGRLV